MAPATKRRIKILAVLPWPDNPTTDGFAQRSHMIIDALNQIGDLRVLITTKRNESSDAAVKKMRKRIRHVDFMPISFATLSLANKGLFQNFSELLAVLLSRPRGFVSRDYLNERKQKLSLEQETFDVAVYRSVPEYLHLSRLICARHQIIDFDERQSEILKVENLNKRKQLLSKLFKYLEKRVASRVDAVGVVKNEDAEDLPSQNVFELRNMPLNRSSSRSEISDSNPPTLAFVGNFTHSPPNVDCARRLLHVIYPRIRAFIPDCKLILAGSGINSVIPPLSSPLPGVDIRGDVKNISDIYALTNIVVYPVEFNPGSSVILPEAICHHVPVVASSQAVKGQPPELVSIGVVIVANHDDEFVSTCIELLKNRKKLKQIKQSTIECASKYFPELYFRTQLSDVIKDLTG